VLQKKIPRQQQMQRTFNSGCSVRDVQEMLGFQLPTMSTTLWRKDSSMQFMREKFLFFNPLHSPDDVCWRVGGLLFQLFP
jgi:hypothetical protein